MRLLYTFGVFGYTFFIRLASLFRSKAREWTKGRENWLSQLPSDKRNVVWFHCASLGEFDQGIPLMNLIKKNQPDIFLIVSFFSPSGYAHHHKRKHSADFVCYLPPDTPKNARKWMEKLQPRHVFFVKYEFWSNYIFEIKRSGGKLYNLSGIFREEQRFFKWYGGFFRRTLREFDYFFVQNEQSKELLKSIDIQCVSISGDTRFDRVIEHRNQAVINPVIEAFKQDLPLLIVGSSWPADEKMLLPWINEYAGKVIIAPHQIDEKHISEIQRQLTREAVLFTQYSANSSDAEVLILNTIGHLSGAYQYGAIAYVGGGFSGGLHNILEPAVFGLPVIFGPKHEKFPEGQQFMEGGFGFSVRNVQEFDEAIHHIQANRKMIREKQLTFVDQQAGASQRVYKSIFK